jgi:hypothetical protein
MAKGVKTGGRVKGSVNKATADLKALAQTYAPDAVKTLAAIMMTSENHTARIAASKELLDRGYGKSIHGVELTGKDGEPVVITRIERKIVDPK